MLINTHSDTPTRLRPSDTHLLPVEVTFHQQNRNLVSRFKLSVTLTQITFLSVLSDLGAEVPTDWIDENYY